MDSNTVQGDRQLVGKLYVVRHGESEWNALGKWTGTTDVELTEKGRQDAQKMGEVIKHDLIDHVFVSEQIRTHQTADEMMQRMEACVEHYTITGALNERDYGIYTGKNKWELKEEVGEEEFHAIRRGWEHTIPDGENLRMVYERVYPFYRDVIIPLLSQQQHVLIIAHGNSIRSLMKYVESISDEGIAEVEMIFGEVVIYTVDSYGKAINKEVRHIPTEPPPA